jgi:hypothetical protein
LSGKEEVFEFNCTTDYKEGGKFKGRILLDYTNLETGMNHTATGDIIEKFVAP